MKRLVVLGTVVFAAALVAGLGASHLIFARLPDSTLPLSGQSGPDAQVSLVTLEGVVSQGSSTTPSTWIVDSYRVRVVPETVIIANGLTVQPGLWARVEAAKDDQQSLEARTVELQSAPSGDIFDRVVAIDADAGVWRVGDTDVTISGQTFVQGTPAVDALVFVHGLWTLDGLAADQAIVQSPSEHAIYQGRISQQQPGQWLVDDVVVDLTGSPVILGYPEIGSLVEVYGQEIGPRTLRAQSIIVSSATTQFQQLVGWLVSIEGVDFPYLWRVNLLEGAGVVPVYVAVFENSQIDQSVATAGYRSWLDIQADHIGNGYYRARRIAVLPRPPKQVVTGIVEQMPDVGLFGQWRVSGRRVDVAPDTAIIGAPQPGSLVSILGTPDYSNAVLAESLEVLGE